MEHLLELLYLIADVITDYSHGKVYDEEDRQDFKDAISVIVERFTNS